MFDVRSLSRSPAISLTSLVLVCLALFACSSSPSDMQVDEEPGAGAGASDEDEGGQAATNRDNGADTTGEAPATPSTEVDPGTDPTPGTPSTTENRDMGNSAGCGKAGAATGAKTITVQVAGKARTYVRFVPAGYDPAKPLALVFGMHGSGGTSAKTRTTFALEAKAAGKAIFVYPQALPAVEPQYDGANRWRPEMDSEDYTFFDTMVKDVEDAYCVDKDRVFVTGFSMGARFTSMLGCYRGDVIRAIAPVAPGMNAATLPLAKGGCRGEVAVWEGWGTEDDSHKEGSLLVRDHYRTVNGCTETRTTTTPTGCESYQGCRGEVPVTWCTYAAGHSWPSIAPGGVWGFFNKMK